MVSQDFARYQLSARENVALDRVGEPDEDAELQSAARRGPRAGIDRGLTGGLGHAAGAAVSWARGGPVRRALYRDAPVLLLDGPTAALEGGRVIADGTPADLLAGGGRYALNAVQDA